MLSRRPARRSAWGLMSPRAQEMTNIDGDESANPYSRYIHESRNVVGLSHAPFAGAAKNDPERE